MFEQIEPSFKDIWREVINNRFNFNEPLPDRPEYLFEIEDGEDSYGIALPGSVIEFSGKPKARKSSLMAGFAAACLAKDKKALNIRSKIEGKVLWIDTEQSRLEFSYFQRMLVRMAGLDRHPDNYIALNIRKYDDNTRFEIVNHAITRNPDLGLIIIDGIADLSMDENEQNSTKALVSRLMYWADSIACPILIAIHTNKDGKESTGHLGGYIDKRCSYHIRVEKNSEESPSLVYPKLSRMGEKFPKFYFAHEQGGLPRILDQSVIGDMEGDNSEYSVLPF
ncbi:MAG: AAA family ATPase [Saprospiraceae bacterium]|nr:AAA family ATPase [Saprospiraceae bacterium]